MATKRRRRAQKNRRCCVAGASRRRPPLTFWHGEASASGIRVRRETSLRLSVPRPHRRLASRRRLAAVARSATRRSLAGNRHYRDVPAGRTEGPLAHADRRRVFRPGGGRWARLRDGPAAREGSQQSEERFRPQPDSRNGTRALFQRGRREATLDARIRLSVHRELRLRSAHHAGGEWRESLYARGRGKSVLSRRVHRERTLGARFQKGLRHSHADVGLRRTSAARWKQAHLSRRRRWQRGGGL